MTWPTITDLATDDIIIEDWVDDVRQGINHLGAMGLAGVAFSALATGTYGARVAVGSYTGNGADNRDITGVGFMPKYVHVQRKTSAWEPQYMLSSMLADQTFNYTGSTLGVSDRIQTVNSDGFQVGTSPGVNYAAETYYYMCIG